MSREEPASSDPAGQRPRHGVSMQGSGPSPAGGLFASIFTTDEMAEATSDAAFVQAMLDVEAALSSAWAAAGVGTSADALLVRQCCRADLFDTAALGRAGRDSANPVLALVGALRELVAEAQASPGTPSAPRAPELVHRGATSQDVLDTAMMLVARSGLALVLSDLRASAHGAATLARTHRETPMVARTLLKDALPTTFGAKAAGWLSGVLSAERSVREVSEHALALQLGGAAGTLAAFGPRAREVAGLVAAELGLEVPVVPWHAERSRIAAIAAALGMASGVAGKIATDVCLMSQSGIEEVKEPGPPGSGGSSALPHKANAALSVAARASALRAPQMVATLFATMSHEHERAAGSWHAEWLTLGELLRAAGGAVANVAVVLEGLEVDADVMRRNLDASQGAVMSEHVVGELADELGVKRARALVSEALGLAATNARAAATDASKDGAAAHGAHGPSRRGGFQLELAALLLAGGSKVDDSYLDSMFDPEEYLGLAPEHADAVLAAYSKEREGWEP